jgi:hypothetical protein
LRSAIGVVEQEVEPKPEPASKPTGTLKGKEVKKLTLGGIFAWIFGVFFVLVGLASFTSSFIAGISCLVISAVLLPPVNRIFREKMNFKLSTGLKIVIIIICFIIFSMAVETDTNPSTADTTPAATHTPEAPTPSATLDEPELGSYENPVLVGESFLSVTGALRITMLEVERGVSVNNAIKAANMFNDDPESGNEYMFVKIRFEYLKGDNEFHLLNSDFNAYANNVECEDPFVVMPDDRPEMQSVTMMQGGTVEKWKCFEVPIGAQVTIAYERLFAVPTYYFDVGD